MTTRPIKFPCPVRRVSMIWRDGEWTIEREIRIASMTLPQSNELPEAARERGVTGFWYEAVDTEGQVIYRRILEDPFEGREVFDNDRIDHIEITPTQASVEILVPDLPEIEELHLYSSSDIPGHERITIGKAERVATISLRGREGGGHGRK